MILEVGFKFIEFSDLFIHFILWIETWDLKNHEEKYDVIPETFNGHNVADFIDPDIMEVLICTNLFIQLNFTKKNIILRN